VNTKNLKATLRAIRIAVVRMDRCSRNDELEEAEKHREKADEYVERLAFFYEERLMELIRAAGWLERISKNELEDGAWPKIKEFIEWVDTERELS
tara:strand:+ start:432 stop:716 length:285 start_codon:yes stop_codon:yes gene_type:complete